MSETTKLSRHGVKDIIEKKVGLMSLVGLCYALVCSGAYGVEELVSASGPGLTIVILTVIPLFWAYPYSLLISELASARPVEGGALIWVKEALGEYWFGIMVLVNFFWGLISCAIYSVLAVQYLGQMVELSLYQTYALKVLILIVFFIVNVLGIKEVSSISTIISIMIISIFIVVAFYGFANMQFNPMEPFMSDSFNGNVFMSASAGLGIGIWLYSGTEEVAIFAGEIKDSHKLIPRSLIIAIPLIAITYIVPTIAGVGSVDQWQDWTTLSDGVGYHTVLSSFAPGFFGVIFIIMAVLGQCATYNILLASAGRTGLILSDENFGPQILAKLSNRFGTPIISLSLVLVTSFFLLGTPGHPLEFKFLALIDVFFIAICYSLVTISAMVLRRRIPAAEYKFNIPGGRPVHNLFSGLSLFFLILVIMVNGTDYFLGGFIVMILMPVLYVIGKRIWKGLSIKEPEAYPIDPKTGLGFDDLKKIGSYQLVLGMFGIIARYFLKWYDGKRDTGYYEQQYGSGLFSNLDSMLQCITIIGICAAAIGIILLLINRILGKPNQ